MFWFLVCKGTNKVVKCKKMGIIFDKLYNLLVQIKIILYICTR